MAASKSIWYAYTGVLNSVLPGTGNGRDSRLLQGPHSGTDISVIRHDDTLVPVLYTGITPGDTP
jgi:hypothetical protein